MSPEWKKFKTLGQLKGYFTMEVLVDECVYVFHDYKPDEDGYCWMNFGFFTFSSQESGTSEDAIEVELLMHGCGPTGSLKECRHTYWGEDGYIFYPNKKYITAVLDWLSRHYDMD